MIHNHSRTAKPHHPSDFFPHFWFVAMNRAFPADRLCFTIFAPAYPLRCVFQKFFTLSTEVALMMLFTAIE
jgi:hypothetical protein